MDHLYLEAALIIFIFTYDLNFLLILFIHLIVEIIRMTTILVSMLSLHMGMVISLSISPFVTFSTHISPSVRHV